jgi:hypothetical protein
VAAARAAAARRGWHARSAAAAAATRACCPRSALRGSEAARARTGTRRLPPRSSESLTVRCPKVARPSAMLCRLPPPPAAVRASRRRTASRAPLPPPRAVSAPPSAPSSSSSSPPAAAFVDDVLCYTRPSRLPRVTAPPGASSLLLLPGFGNESSDYTAPFGNESASVASALRSRGFDVHVLPVVRKDWFNVARGLLTPGFYAGTCTTEEGALAAAGVCVARRTGGCASLRVPCPSRHLTRARAHAHTHALAFLTHTHHYARRLPVVPGPRCVRCRGRGRSVSQRPRHARRPLRRRLAGARLRGGPALQRLARRGRAAPVCRRARVARHAARRAAGRRV